MVLDTNGAIIPYKLNIETQYHLFTNYYADTENEISNWAT